ncbi:MAG TPA: PPC domain-containing DNA-binding protein [Bryobacteraceae bacterium]|jgi:predicted DNA-binding protein with PD1-like motif|nr:PPC domain-containing DNA-binding protein [Bryobacteraceae bacterium]
MRLSLFLFTLLCLPALAERTQTEVTKPTTPHDDARPNDPKVPDVVALTGQFDRVVVLRFKYEADLLACLESALKTEKIQNGVILAGAGSVRNYHIHAVSNRTFPSKNIYTKDSTSPADIVSMNGYVIDGRVHAHMTMANAEHAFGGHLEPGTNVFTFAIITVGVFKPGIDLKRIDDKTYR